MHISDVESNHGQERSETAATTNSINDAGAEAAAGAADGSQEKANDSIEAGAEAAQDKQQKGEQGLVDLEQAGVPKTLKNLNSTMADIINMPDTTATTTIADGKGKANEAESGKYHGQLLPLGRQLANNLPAQSMQEKEKGKEQEQTPLAGEKLSVSLQAQSGLPTDQQATARARAGAGAEGAQVVATTSTAAASAWTSKQSSTDAGKAGSCLPQTLPSSGDGDGGIAKAGAEAGAGAASIASTMMDGRQTVDFIEGDSFTSTANYDAVDAVANHKDEKQLQKVEQQQQEEEGLGLGQTELMKTPPHTSNRVTTAAEAATGNN